MNSGWYSILKARFFTALPGRAGTAMAVSNLAGLLGSLVPMGLGLVAEAVGLRAAMWLLLVGPLALFLGLPRTHARRGYRARSRTSGKACAGKS